MSTGIHQWLMDSMIISEYRARMKKLEKERVKLGRAQAKLDHYILDHPGRPPAWKVHRMVEDIDGMKRKVADLEQWTSETRMDPAVRDHETREARVEEMLSKRSGE